MEPAASPAIVPKDIPIKCLLVDDQPENLQVLSALLHDEADVEVLQASSGPQALELARQHDLALAFLDVQMPDMDGFELAALLRGSERTRHIPLIFVTAGAHNATRIFQGYETGAVDFLFKPVDPRILQMKARVFFDLYRTRRQLAEELAERTETLRLAETFSAILGHDLRSPLSVIQMMAALLQHKSDDPGVQQKARQIADCGKLMNRMIADILDLSRARLGGGLPITRGDLNARKLVEALTERKRALYPTALIDVRSLGDLSACWDADRIDQLLTNLINNAAHHGSLGQPIEVTVDGSQADAIVVSVRNHGAIAPDILPHIFEPFHRAKIPRSTEGLGLGLYIAREIARAHGGDIDADVADGQHTVMRVRLPRRAHGAAA